MVPYVLLVFPSTVLLPRDKSTAGEPKFSRPIKLFVTVEFETLTVATPVERLCAAIPVLPWDATQLSTSISAAALLAVEQIKPKAQPEATLFRAVTVEPSSAKSP